MKVITFVREDGGLTVRNPAYPAFPNTPDGQAAALALALSTAPAWAEVIEDSALPTDRTFRDAWKQDLTVDMPKAREIAKKRSNDPRIDSAKSVDELKAILPKDKSRDK